MTMVVEVLIEKGYFEESKYGTSSSKLIKSFLLCFLLTHIIFLTWIRKNKQKSKKKKKDKKKTKYKA